MTVLSKRILGWAGGVVALAFVAGTTGASAGTTGPNFCLNSSGTDCQLQLDLLNLTGYPGPYVHGDVTIKDSHTLEFTFSALSQTSGATTYKYFFGNLAFDLVGTVSGESFVSGHRGLSGTALTSGNVTFGNGLGEDGFGTTGANFGNTSIFTGNGFPNALTDLVFDLTWSDKTWTNLLSDEFMDLSEHGSRCQGSGCSAAGHVFILSTTDTTLPNSSWTQVATGYGAWPNACDQGIGEGCSSVAVPEPATLAILGTGLVGLGLAARRRRNGMLA